MVVNLSESEGCWRAASGGSLRTERRPAFRWGPRLSLLDPTSDCAALPEVVPCGGTELVWMSERRREQEREFLG